MVINSDLILKLAQGWASSEPVIGSRQPGIAYEGLQDEPVVGGPEQRVPEPIEPGDVFGKLILALAKHDGPLSLHDVEHAANKEELLNTEDIFHHPRWDGVKPTKRELAGTPQKMNLDVGKLVPNQDHVKSQRVMDYVNKPDLAHSEKSGTWREDISAGPTGDGRYVVFDGHHRVSAAILRGKKKVPVEVYPKALSAV